MRKRSPQALRQSHCPKSAMATNPRVGRKRPGKQTAERTARRLVKIVVRCAYAASCRGRCADADHGGAGNGGRPAKQLALAGSDDQSVTVRTAPGRLVSR
jgi:hypothetical protein